MNIIPISGSLGRLNLEETVAQGSSMLPFSEILADSLKNLQETQETSRQDAYDLALGRSDDLHSIMINSAVATTALEMTVQVATRAVSAYKEILQMQV